MSRKYKVRAFEHQIGSPCRCSTIWNNVISYWGKCKANRIVNVSRDPNEMSKFVPQPSHICREKVQSQKLHLRRSNKLIALSLSTITYILQATILHISTLNPDAKYFEINFLPVITFERCYTQQHYGIQKRFSSVSMENRTNGNWWCLWLLHTTISCHYEYSTTSTFLLHHTSLKREKHKPDHKVKIYLNVSQKRS